MYFVLATSNAGKVKEIQKLLGNAIPYTDVIAPFEIEETGSTFAQNALIKARAVYSALNDPQAVVIADDSGISIDALGGAPGIYSARYGGSDATDRDNLAKVITDLHALGKERSSAHYTAAIAIVDAQQERCVHGWMYGEVITTPRGENGFGYDPIFIPEGYDHTLGELGDEIKKKLSHRAKALALAQLLL